MEYQAEPAGALLAMLAGLYDDRIHAVAASGGLAEFMSVLRSPFTYVSMDALVPGILKTADIPDIASALAPHSLLITDCVDGRNVALGSQELNNAFGRARKSYADSPQRLTISAAMAPAAVVDWIMSCLRN
jgi:hypothetical protein